MFIYIVLCPLHKQYNDTVSVLHDGVIIGAGVAESSTASSLTPDFYGNLCFPCFNVSFCNLVTFTLTMNITGIL